MEVPAPQLADDSEERIAALLGASQLPGPDEETHEDYNEADMMESEKRDFALQFMRSLGWTGTLTGSLTQERASFLVQPSDDQLQDALAWARALMQPACQSVEEGSFAAYDAPC